MKLSIVVPCYNEQEVLKDTSSKLLEVIKELRNTNKISEQSYIYFVDDGSNDNTWDIIEELSEQNKEVKGIKLSKNNGHQNALLAGLFNADGDAVVSIDADLQDDIKVITQMLDAYSQGCDIVYGVRNNREHDAFFKRFSATLYYKLLASMGVDTVFNHADYRLLSHRAIRELEKFKEVNLFVRGIIPLLGFKSKIVSYSRGRRLAGESKYPLGKMLALAIQGITSFSAVPLRMITVLGLCVFVISTALGLWSFWARIFGNEAVPGWASTVIPIYFLGGVQLLSIGIIGEYLAKIYLETKSRPRFIIEKKI